MNWSVMIPVSIRIKHALRQPRPQGFSLKNGRPTHFFEGKALGTRLGLRTTDCGLGIKHGPGIKRGPGIKDGLRTTLVIGSR